MCCKERSASLFGISALSSMVDAINGGSADKAFTHLGALHPQLRRDHGGR